METPGIKDAIWEENVNKKECTCLQINYLPLTVPHIQAHVVISFKHYVFDKVVNLAFTPNHDTVTCNR